MLKPKMVVKTIEKVEFRTMIVSIWQGASSVKALQF